MKLALRRLLPSGVTFSGALLQKVFEKLDMPASDETSEKILDAALAQFEEFGLRRTTMEDVAGRAGVSRVTIYRRFPSKDGLIEAVLLREALGFFAELDAAVEPYEATDDRLVEGFAFTLDFLRDHALLQRLLRSEPDALLPHLTIEGGPIIAAARTFLAERLGQEVLEGRLPPLDVEVAGELLSRVVLSFILTPQSAVDLTDRNEARRFARRYLAPSLHVTAAAVDTPRPA
jgi:AcrR family transcriptional regulator